MRKYTFLLAAGALGLSGAALALASSYNDGKPHALEQADADGNGEITRAEAQAQSVQNFAKLDVNADGQITAEDRAAARALRFTEADSDGNGELSAEEMAARQALRDAERTERRAALRERKFAALDKDGSGGLSQAELEAGDAMRAQKRSKRYDRRGKGERSMRLIGRADANGDKAVTLEEFEQSEEARFARLDTDQSGTISAAELDAARQARLEKRSARLEERRSMRLEQPRVMKLEPKSEDQSSK